MADAPSSGNVGDMARREQEVAVIVPMHNAEDTIRETLASICQQTWQNLDIVVVDDGSTDRSAEIVAESARRDPRIRLLRQENAGVAVARNNGVANTDAGFLAFIDADDLWAPDKIAAQMAVLSQGNGAPALVYCWFVQIDAHGRIYPTTAASEAIEGEVLRDICRRNFIGNCSSLLVPKEVFARVGGFDPSLRERKAQGCEDLLFFAQVAKDYEFRLVPRHLLGYRLSNHNMSSNTDTMLRSFDLVADRLRAEFPEHAAELAENRRDFLLWLGRRAAMAGRLPAAFELTATLHGENRKAAIPTLANLARTYMMSKVVPRWAKEVAERAGLKPQRASYLGLPW